MLEDRGLGGKIYKRVRVYGDMPSGRNDKMTTKAGMLSLREKQRVEELLKCSRERKRLHVMEGLDKLREEIEKPFNVIIDELQRRAENVRIDREKAVVRSGYGKIRERGCYDVHPELDAFDAETNRLLVQLWKTTDGQDLDKQE
jgi:hypothetical protein